MRQNVHLGLLDFGASLLSDVTAVKEWFAWVELLPLALSPSWSTLSTCQALSMSVFRDFVPGNLLSNDEVQKTVYHFDLLGAA